MAPQLTPTKKARIFQWHLEGRSNVWIAEQLGRNRRTIDRQVQHLCQNPDPYVVQPGRGRPRVIGNRDLQEACLELKRGHARDGEDVHRLLFPQLGASTVRRALANIGLRGRVRRKKPFLSVVHVVRRRNWEFRKRDMTLEEWINIWFSDESKFNLIGSDGKRYCRRDVVGGKFCGYMN